MIVCRYIYDRGLQAKRRKPDIQTGIREKSGYIIYSFLFGGVVAIMAKRLTLTGIQGNPDPKLQLVSWWKKRNHNYMIRGQKLHREYGRSGKWRIGAWHFSRCRLYHTNFTTSYR